MKKKREKFLTLICVTNNNKINVNYLNNYLKIKFQAI